MSTLRFCALSCTGLLALGCGLGPEAPSPFAEVKIVVDTDLDVEAFVARLQVDLYDADETWFFSQELQREDPQGWPSSFVLVGPRTIDEGAEPRVVFVRLRVFPDGKLRDYRGERFFGPDYKINEQLTEAERQECLPLLPSNYGEREQKLLEQEDAQGQPMPPFSPQNEPLPDLTIDRIVPVLVEPGVQGEVRVVLRGNCLGAQAGFGPSIEAGDELVCDNGEYRTATVEEAEPSPNLPELSLVGTFPKAQPCEQSAPAEWPAFGERICVDGGMFFLGDPAVFAYGNFDAVPEHVALIDPLVIDKYEVTVGRFREALEQGLLNNVELPIKNEGPLDFDGDDEALNCTFSTEPLSRENYPLNCVTWKTARAFCQASGGDLPTEAQWEYVAAAAGRDNRETRFAWGSEEPTCDRAVYARSASPAKGATECAPDHVDVGVQPVTVDSKDRTPLGVVGMGGSLRELTLDANRPYCAQCWFDAPISEPSCDVGSAVAVSVRGGDWASDEDSLLVGLRNQDVASAAEFASDDSPLWSSRVGFRCVRRGTIE
jgi:formylglycine-generating enzyme required for sulfatase activity